MNTTEDDDTLILTPEELLALIHAHYYLDQDTSDVDVQWGQL